MAATARRLWAALNLGGLTVREAAMRTWERMNEHEIWTRAAAIAFYAIAALVPFLALVITLTAHLLPTPLRRAVSEPSRLAGPADSILDLVPVVGLIWSMGVRGLAGPAEKLLDMLPGDAASIVIKEIQRLQEGPPPGLVSFGLVATLWLSLSVFVAIMDAMNRILGVRETRTWWKQRLIAMLMALSQAAILIAAFLTMIAWPQILHFLGLDRTTALLVTVVHGILVFVMTLLSFAMTMYFGPDADQCWEWITPGSLLGSLVLMLSSLLFRIYVQRWGNYSATYGSLGGIVLLMTWIWLCSVTLLAAAELNKVIKDASPLGRSCGPETSDEDHRADARAASASASGRGGAGRSD